MIAGALGPPKDSAVAPLTKLTSGPLGPMSKLRLPVDDLTVGTAVSTKSLSWLALPTFIPVSLTDRLTKVPTLVNEELTTLAAKVLAVNVSAAAGTVTSPRPVNVTPFILGLFTNCLAALAVPVNVAPTKVLAWTTLKELVPVSTVTFPVTFPTKLAVIVPAANPPSEFLATTLPIMLAELASTDHVCSVLPSKSLPVRYEPFLSLFVVLALTVISV